MAERPDPAFKQVFPTAGSTLWLDPKGCRGEYPSSPAIAMTTDRAGAPIAERGLAHDVYRSDVNADGSGILFLSREGILHGYSGQLDPLILEKVEELPEYAAQAIRFGIQPHELKNHTRCVALSTDRSRFLVTIVDEAWCYDINTGVPLWGLRFPGKDGWSEVATDRSDRVGTSDEITSALTLMELRLSVNPEALTRSYHLLARRWHPDLNPDDPGATRRLQDLNAAMELLSGSDPSLLGSGVAGPVTYTKALGGTSVTVDGIGTLSLSVSMQITGASGADWVYAANFAHVGHGAFLAGYGGRIVEVDSSGSPIRIYDIGAVPRHVADTPERRYILTDTRLYVLREDSLEAIVDVNEQGHLIVGANGFGLLAPKQLQWFSATGQLQGSVLTRDPIRRVLSKADGLVVETRTRRALIIGAPNWW